MEINRPEHATRNRQDAGNHISNVYDDGYLRVEHEHFYVTLAGRPFYDFTRKEFYLLSRLVRDCGRAVRTEELWAAAWAPGVECNPRTLRAHISSLRRKLAPYQLTIATVVHVGYRLLRHNETAYTANTIQAELTTQNLQPLKEQLC